MSVVNKAPTTKTSRILNKKNNSHQVSHLFPFPSQNESVFFISNLNMQNAPNAPNLPIESNLNLENVKIETRVFPVLTKSNGFPRIIQEVKINIGNKILTLTNMTTNLIPSALTDEYYSQIISTLTPHNGVNEYKIEFNEQDLLRNEHVLQSTEKIKRAEGLNADKLANSNEIQKMNEEEILKNDEKILELSGTLVSDKNECEEQEDADSNANKKFFTIKKKITKHNKQCV